MKNKNLLIRNSTAEFLIFIAQAGEQSIEARHEDETVWLSQKLMAVLFDVDVRTVNKHLKNIYAQQELTPDATIRKFRIVQKNFTIFFSKIDIVFSVCCSSFGSKRLLADQPYFIESASICSNTSIEC